MWYSLEAMENQKLVIVYDSLREQWHSKNKQREKEREESKNEFFIRYFVVKKFKQNIYKCVHKISLKYFLNHEQKKKIMHTKKEITFFIYTAVKF